MGVVNHTISKLRNVEERWYDRLYKQCRQYFPPPKLPSHNHHHHRRVWYIARNLIIELGKRGKTIDEQHMEALIVACFFHDTGMHVSTNEDHGKVSRIFCETAFRQNNWPLPDLFEETLDAVEHHDDKTYQRVTRALSTNILDVLNVCDDLDAFGAIGVFRYLEIYLERGCRIPDMPKRICENLACRFDHFTNLYSGLDHFYEDHSQRYHFILAFYTQLDDLLKTTHYSETCFTGPVGILNYLLGILQQKQHVLKAARNFSSAANDPEIKGFFYELSSELSPYGVS